MNSCVAALEDVSDIVYYLRAKYTNEGIANRCESVYICEPTPMEVKLFENTEVAFASKDNKELKKALWLFRMIGKPFMVSVGKVCVNIALALRIPFGWALRNNIFAHFCGGETIEDCAKATQVLDNYGVGTILDYSVEGKQDENDFDRGLEELLAVVKTAHGNEHIPFCVFKVTGIARFSLLQKSNEGKTLSENELQEFGRIRIRIDAICKAAFEADTPVFIDAEESWIQDTIDQLADEMMLKYNKERAIVYNTVQLYRHDRLAFLKSSHQKAQQEGYFLGVKLVRGAYMEKERERAKEWSYQDPIQPDKPSTDRDFDLALEYCAEHSKDIACCAGTHNEYSSELLTKLMTQYGIRKGDKRMYFAQLFGMSDQISFNLANMGYNVAKYVPYGPIRDVIPYLIRRAEENTSVKGQTGRELKLIQAEVKRRRKA